MKANKFIMTKQLSVWSRAFTLLIVFFSITKSLTAQELKKLPQYHKESVKTKQDWLLGGIKESTKLYRTEDDDLVLSNGLISRVFAIKQGGATIGIDNLMTGENMLRSVKPEAQVVMDDMPFDVGGLEGQPIHNYLLAEWIPDLLQPKDAFTLQNFTSGPTEERFAWKKREDWMPKDLPWPPPGKKLSFSYAASEELIDFLIKNSQSDAARTVLYSDNFQQLGDQWKIYASSADARNSFINEGKAGEIMAKAQHAVYAEMPNPKGAKVWIVELDAGTDQSASWGPGLTLVAKDKRTYKINLRPSENKIGVYDGKRERVMGAFTSGEAVKLKISQQENELVFYYATTGTAFQELYVLPVEDLEIAQFRLGKTDKQGSGKDAPSKGESGRSHVLNVKVLGELDEVAKKRALNGLQYIKNIEVQVHYEMYDGIPLLSKWITIINKSDQKILLNSFKSESLALAETESAVDSKIEWVKPNVSVATDYRFGGMSNDNLYKSSIAWNPDPDYKTQVNYQLETPVLLEAYPKLGPMLGLQPGDSLESFRIWELFHDSWDRERKGLAEKKMYRTQAPWATENPIMMHVRQADNASVKKAIDQCAEVGFEMVIMTFGSGFEIENDSPENIRRMKELTDYAHSKGVALGGYSLLASRRISPEDDVVMPEGMKPRFGNSPCLESEWGHQYFDKLYNFYQKTGQDILEHDGSYPGDVCASHDHPGHNGLEDSQWKQYDRIKTFYEWARGKGIFLNVPDHYFMAGSNKTGMGYRETNWSLPRAQQEIVERQNVYDGTWQKTPSMGWMFVPLVEYHGGGAAATIEPLKDHLPHYEQRLANLFGAGVQACYRGPQLFDSPETKAVVKKWVDFYKAHREVLDSDIIHLRRPDGRDYDGIMHVNPEGKEKGLIMLYNPLETPITKTIEVDLYYTGLTDQAHIVDAQGKVTTTTLDRSYRIPLEVNIPARSQAWYILQ